MLTSRDSSLPMRMSLEVIQFLRNSLSSRRSEKWAEVDRQVRGSVGIRDSCQGSKKEWTDGKIVDLREVYFLSSSSYFVKSKA